MTGKRRGRPPINHTALGRRTIYLTSDEIMTATLAGQGNLSDGIRRLIKEVHEYRLYFAERMTRLDHPDPLPRHDKQH
jgi:hypothetical protein